jgi:nicotinamidase-related amidase
MKQPHPWDGVIPQSDIDSFNDEPSNMDRAHRGGPRPALLVVDVTYMFVDSRFPTGHSATGWPAVAQIVRVLAAARAAGIPVYFTKSWADDNYRPAPAEQGKWRSRKTWSATGDDLPPGDAIVAELAPQPGEIIIAKGKRPSAFFSTPLIAHMVADDVDTVIVTGLTTSGCVRATVLDAFQYNLEVLVPHECTADRSQLSHQVTLFDLHMKYADVITTDTTIEYLDGMT